MSNFNDILFKPEVPNKLIDNGIKLQIALTCISIVIDN